MRRTLILPLALASALVGTQSSAAASCSEVDAQQEGLTASDWSGIRTAYEVHRHAACPTAGGYQARNPGQGWTLRFDGRGFETRPDANDWTWGFDLVSYGWGSDQQVMAAPLEVTAEGGRVAYDWDERLTEWYINDTRGLEHGYTVRERAEGSSGHLALELAIRGELAAVISADGRDVRFVRASGEAVLNYAGLTVFDATGEELPAEFLAIESGLRLEVDDAGAKYPLTIDPIAQQAYLKASNTDPDDSFGQSVAISGNTAIVGAPLEDSVGTGVDGEQFLDYSSASGAAYVFVRNGSTWSQEAYLKSSTIGAGDYFGTSVSISGDMIVVGAYGEDSSSTGVDSPHNGDASSSGAAYVFVRSGGIWTPNARLKASNTGTFDFFGWSVSISGETIIVGARGEDSSATGVNGDQSDNDTSGSGAAYVFVRSGSTWSQEAYLKASNAGANDDFGRSVAVSGDLVIVGARGEDSSATGVNGNQANNSATSSGAAYVFVRNSSTWSQEVYLKASNTGADDYFGLSVAVAGDTVVVGAPQEKSNATGVNGNQNDDSATGAGAAYVFTRSGNTWSQEAYLKASNTGGSDPFGPGDEFGGAVAVSGDAVVVGARSERSHATGINGSQADDSAFDAGAAYLFVRGAGAWSQEAYIKGSNTYARDLFGGSVAISEGFFIVGAPGESSNATGVNGVQNDNSAEGSGAAYILTFPPSSTGTAYCSGDGNGAPCPCGNDNDGSNGVAGCANGASSGGASLGATGTPSVSSDTVVMTVTGLDPGQPGLFFRADNALSGSAFGDGLRCAGGNLVRLGVAMANASGVALSSQPMGANLVGGDLMRYQYWYRNPTGSPCNTGFNLSNGLEISWTP